MLKKLVITLLATCNIIVGVQAGEIVDLYLKSEKYLIWKAKTTNYWVKVQQSTNLVDWETILIHGETPPYHLLMVKTPKEPTFWRVVPLYE